MTSLLTSVRQVSADSGYFVALADDQQDNIFSKASVLAYKADPNSTPTAVSSLPDVNAGGLLKDMGKTISVSVPDAASPLLFRKVQVVTGVAEANGVGGGGPSTTDDGHLTGYILLGTNGAAGSGIDVARVAKYGV